jgi:putative NIF3 family GTP cyclohydrolase 1 type 2
MILRNYKGHEISVNKQQLSASTLLKVVKMFKDFPILTETFREILEDYMDIEHAKEILKKIEGIENAGLGRIGKLNNKMRLQNFLVLVKRTFRVNTVRVISNNFNKEVEKIAIVGGSGGSLIYLAVQKGADVLITGDIDYHDALNALSLELILIDAGHFNTEYLAYRKFGERFSKKLKEKGFKVKMVFDDERLDPFYTI